MNSDNSHITARQQRASEYFLENERLTRELTDDQARVLIDWASQQASTAAGDPARSDEALEEVLQALRRAVRHVARSAADEHDAERLRSMLQEAWQQAGQNDAQDAPDWQRVAQGVRQASTRGLAERAQQRTHDDDQQH
jgi:hypothetical protein